MGLQTTQLENKGLFDKIYHFSGHLDMHFQKAYLIFKKGLYK